MLLSYLKVMFSPFDAAILEPHFYLSGINFIINRDVGTKFQSSESLSHLIASVLILEEPKTAENRKLSWENDEAQTQKLNQGRIIVFVKNRKKVSYSV
jgi:hypothetical protein